MLTTEQSKLDPVQYKNLPLMEIHVDKLSASEYLSRSGQKGSACMKTCFFQ